MLRKTTMALVGASLLFGSVACSNTPAPEPKTTPSVASSASAGAIQNGDVPVFMLPADTKVSNSRIFTENNTLISTVGDEFSVTAYGIGNDLSLNGEETTPTEGEVFHFISYERQPGADVAFSIDVNGKSTSLNGMEDKGIIAVSAPEDATVKVLSAVTLDGEKVVQAMNASTAERITNNREVLYKNTSGEFTEGTLQGPGGESAAVQDVTRTDWLSNPQRWADRDEAFIVVSLSEMKYGSEKASSTKSHTLKLVDKNGKTYTSEQIGEEIAGGETHVFTVPLKTDDYTIHAEISEKGSSAEVTTKTSVKF